MSSPYFPILDYENLPIPEDGGYCDDEDRKKIKVRLLRENYKFVEKIYNKYFDDILTFDKFFNEFMRGIIFIGSCNIIVVDDDVHINYWQTKIFKYIFEEFKNFYFMSSKVGFVNKNMRIRAEDYCMYEDFGRMCYAENYDDFFVVNNNVNYTRLFNFFIFFISKNEHIIHNSDYVISVSWDNDVTYLAGAVFDMLFFDDYFNNNALLI